MLAESCTGVNGMDVCEASPLCFFERSHNEALGCGVLVCIAGGLPHGRGKAGTLRLPQGRGKAGTLRLPCQLAKGLNRRFHACGPRVAATETQAITEIF